MSTDYQLKICLDHFALILAFETLVCIFFNFVIVDFSTCLKHGKLHFILIFGSKFEKHYRQTKQITMPTFYHEMVWKYSVTHKTVHVGVRARPDKPGEQLQADRRRDRLPAHHAKLRGPHW